MNNERIPDTPARHLRYHRLGNMPALVVLDSGLNNGQETWARIVPELSHFTSTLLLDRGDYPPGSMIDVEHESAEIVRLISNDKLAGSPAKSRILVGAALGTAILQAVAASVPELIRGLVLVDPVPLSFLQNQDYASIAPDGTAMSAHHLIHDEIEVPATIILPGSISPPDGVDAEEWRTLRELDIQRFPQRREIIAGRSKLNIAAERPDVMIDAIQHYL